MPIVVFLSSQAKETEQEHRQEVNNVKADVTELELKLEQQTDLV